jgi:hypothetical protein
VQFHGFFSGCATEFGVRLAGYFSRYAATSLAIALLAGSAATSLPASPIIQYQATVLDTNGLGQELVQYNYSLSGFNLVDVTTPTPHDYELDIEFDPTVYLQLSNGEAGPGFNLLLFQPNNPPGASGVYSALATVNDPSTTGTFSVDALLAAGKGPPPPDAQTWVIDDDSQSFTQISSGAVSQQPVAGAPEPPSYWLCGVGLLTVGWTIRRRLATKDINA